MQLFNPLDHPIIFEIPDRLTEVTSWHHHIPFAFLMIDLLRPRVFVELGVHKGDSYNAICQAVNFLNLNTSCYGIDTWQGDEHASYYEQEIMQELQNYHDPKYARFSRLIQSTFDVALEHFADGSIDLLHIDGLHTYDAVKHDFETWLPKMSERGIILFHDTNVRERGFGVWKFWAELNAQYPAYEFKFGHGLGVLFVGEHANDKILCKDKEDWKFLEMLFHSLGNRCFLIGQEKLFSSTIADLTQQRNELASRFGVRLLRACHKYLSSR